MRVRPPPLASLTIPFTPPPSRRVKVLRTVAAALRARVRQSFGLSAMVEGVLGAYRVALTSPFSHQAITVR